MGDPGSLRELASGWQSLTEALSVRIFDTVLVSLRPRDAARLACTCRHWNAISGATNSAWERAFLERWVNWCACAVKDNPASIASLFEGDAEYVGHSLTGLAWSELYAQRLLAVERAASSALKGLSLQGNGRFGQLEDLSAALSLWDCRTPRQIEFPAWSAALSELREARLDVADVAVCLLTADSALANLLGVHYLMSQPWVAPKESPPAQPLPAVPEELSGRIRRMLKANGCGGKHAAVRWWELGVLMMDAGWRTSDIMRTVSGTLDELLENRSLWRVLLRGPEMEVRRIVLEEDF
uniref:F-box domain-containing protein n=2 Tax=Tetraselmis sp. GSL018 TaxID=582737 RepID=A0A061RYV6_9CHLO